MSEAAKERRSYTVKFAPLQKGGDTAWGACWIVAADSLDEALEKARNHMAARQTECSLPEGDATVDSVTLNPYPIIL